MFISAARLVLDFYGNTKLPQKRQEMKKLAEALHRKFNVSAHEIREKVDDPERCILGLCAVASSAQDARSFMDKIVKFADGISFARVTTEDIDIFQFEGSD